MTINLSHLPDLADSSLRAVLYRYWLENGIPHALRAELYHGEQLVIRTRPIHCHAMTDQVFKAYLQSLLDSFSQHSKLRSVFFQEFVDLKVSRYFCPVQGCHLSRSYSFDDLL
ncbi:MAG: hypothetical protein ACKO21_12695 [Nodosilinea sp.]